SVAEPRTSQNPGGASGSATESHPSARSPRRHSTKPPKIDRAEIGRASCRERVESYVGAGGVQRTMNSRSDRRMGAQQRGMTKRTPVYYRTRRRPRASLFFFKQKTAYEMAT